MPDSTREEKKPWCFFFGGLALGLFINLFALIGLCLIKDSRKRKFFGIGAVIGLLAEIIVFVAVGAIVGAFAAVAAS